MMISRIVSSTLALAMAAGPAAAQTRQQPPAPGPARDFVIPTPTRFTLDNGLPVTMVPFGRVPKVTVRLVVDAGNADEQKDQVWLADLLGRMLQEGTDTLSADALAREFAGMGGQLGISVGADTTTVTTDVLSEQGPKAVGLLASVVRQPRLPASELARLQANLARELAVQRASPQAIAAEKFAELVYGDHPYGRTFPTEAMLNGYTLDQVRAFHRDHFGAGRARLYVAGVFDRDAMQAAVRQAFDGWAKGQPRAASKPPADSTTRFALVDRAGAPQSTVRLGVAVADPSHADWIPLVVTDSLLGGSFASRITSNIREDKGYTYSPFSSISSHPDVAHWVQTADVTTAMTGASLKEIFFEIDRLRKEEPSAQELQGIKNNLAGVFVVQNASRGGVISQLAFVDLHDLGADYLSQYVKRVMAVSPEAILRMSNKYLTPDQMTLVIVGDEKTVKEQAAPYIKK